MAKISAKGGANPPQIGKVNVNVSIDKLELADIKATTHIDSSATALLAAARLGIEYLRSHLGH